MEHLAGGEAGEDGLGFGDDPLDHRRAGDGVEQGDAVAGGAAGSLPTHQQDAAGGRAGSGGQARGNFRHLGVARTVEAEGIPAFVVAAEELREFFAQADETLARATDAGIELVFRAGGGGDALVAGVEGRADRLGGGLAGRGGGADVRADAGDLVGRVGVEVRRELLERGERVVRDGERAAGESGALPGVVPLRAEAELEHGDAGDGQRAALVLGVLQRGGPVDLVGLGGVPPGLQAGRGGRVAARSGRQPEQRLQFRAEHLLGVLFQADGLPQGTGTGGGFAEELDEQVVRFGYLLGCHK